MLLDLQAKLYDLLMFLRYMGIFDSFNVLGLSHNNKSLFILSKSCDLVFLIIISHVRYQTNHINNVNNLSLSNNLKTRISKWLKCWGNSIFQVLFLTHYSFPMLQLQQIYIRFSKDKIISSRTITSARVILFISGKVN